MKAILTFIVLLSMTCGFIGCDKLPKQPPGKLVFQTNRGLTKEQKIAGIKRIMTYSEGEMKTVYEGLVYLARWHSNETISFQLYDRNDLGDNHPRTNKRLAVINLNGEIVKEFSIDKYYRISDYDWHPNEDAIAAIEDESAYYAKQQGRKPRLADANRVSLYNFKINERKELLSVDKYRYTTVSFSPDGQFLALGRRLAGEDNRGEDNNILILELATRKVEVVLEDATLFDWTNSGDKLLFREFRKAGTFWAHSVMGTYDLTTKKKKFFHKPPLFTFSARMAPDDKSVVYHSAGITDKLCWVSTKGGKRKLFLDYSKTSENDPIEDMFHDWTA